MIEYLLVEIKPAPKDLTSREMTIRVQVTGHAQRTLREVWSTDDLTSHFDRIFDRAKREIHKQLIAEHQT
jgi:hypothetical protein